MKILIAEDDRYTREGLAEILEEEGYRTVLAGDGDEALRLLAQESPDAVCLDIMMPGLDGYDVCRRIREHDPALPILFISAKSEEADKVLGLDLGADDFITKPFGVKEVVARIRAVTRRCLTGKASSGEDDSFSLGGLVVKPKELRAYRDDSAIDLSLREVRILELLYMNPGKALDREVIFNKCWGIDYLPNSRTLDQHIAQLRKKIEADPKDPAIIKTVHGVGYRYDEA